MSNSPQALWLVYDGDCPFCSAGAGMYRLRQSVGELHIVNAREIAGSELMNAIDAHGFDLNTGIVARFEDRLYHGKDALHLLALLGSETGWFNRVNVALFRHKAILAVAYPVMVFGRNTLLRLRGEKAAMTAAIFAEVFADQWQALPPAMHRHYANRPFTRDCVTVEGNLTIRMHPLMKLIAPVMAIMGMLTPWTGEDVPCTVRFLSQPDGKAFVFDRRFSFPDRGVYQFRSELIARGAHDVIEYMRCGIGWRCGYSFDGRRVILSHKGYVWRLFGVDVPLPGAGLIVGRGEAFEEATGDDSFAMFMGLRHPLLGRLYSYEGAFTVTEMRLA